MDATDVAPVPLTQEEQAELAEIHPGEHTAPAAPECQSTACCMPPFLSLVFF